VNRNSWPSCLGRRALPDLVLLARFDLGRACWIAGVCVLLAACDDVVEDPAFERWCGARLCDWDTDSGQIARSHGGSQREQAVELLGDSSQISQHSSTSARCLSFHALVQAEEHSDAHIAVDFNDDGTVEFEHKISSARRGLVEFSLAAPLHYVGARIFVRKLHPGKLVLAQLRVQRTSGCHSRRVALKELPGGAGCSDHDECSSRICSMDVCAECALDVNCADNQLCVAGYCTRCASGSDCRSELRAAVTGEERQSAENGVLQGEP